MLFPRFGRVLPRLLTAAAALLAMAPASAQTAAPFPLLPGEAVVTCSSGSNPAGFVLAVFDLRDPVANAPGTDLNWPAPAFHAAGWTRSGFGGNEVFGVALDDATPANIYLTSTSSYGGGLLGSGKVFRIDGATAAVSVFAELPNCDAFPDCPGASYAGLGNIAYDAAHRQLFVTNFYDGKIYRLKLDATGALDPAATTTFDPFSPFDPTRNTAGFAPLGERLWGIGVQGDRVYFGVWATDGRFRRPQVANTVWSVALDAAGNFSGPAELEVTLPQLGSDVSNPVADIAFSVEGRMLLAERSMVGDAMPGADRSRVLEYEGGHGVWALSLHNFQVGRFGASAAGGVDYVCRDQEAATEWVLATGDALHFNLRPPDKIYGIAVFPPTGGSSANAYLVDLDGDTTSGAKTTVGDVEALDQCVQAPRSPDLDLSLVTGVDTAGTHLPRGSVDPIWSVRRGDGTSDAAVLVADPPPSWRQFRASEWIAVDASGQAPAGASTVRFERCFCLAADADNAKINLRLRADDVATVLLNGTPIAGPGGGFRRETPLSILYMGLVGASLFQPGSNCLQVDVQNIRGVLLALDAVGRLWVDHGTCTEGPP